jgi:protein gp37
MGEHSGIAWTDHTFNPWVGCTKVGPGCDGCYAEAWNARFNGGVAPNWGVGAPRRRTTEQNWNKVRRWDREARASGIRTRVFCASLADVFDNEVPEEWRRDLWAVVAECWALDWILLTKRIGNVAKMAPTAGFPGNVIILATIVNQEEADRDREKLLSLKRFGVVRRIGVSCEPALGAIDWDSFMVPAGGTGTSIDWLIVGGESTQGAHRARPFRAEWARDAIRQGRRLAASCRPWIVMTSKC